MTPMAWSGFLFSSLGQKPRPTLTVSSISNFFFLSSVQMSWSGLTSSMFWLVWMSAAVTAPSLLTESNSVCSSRLCALNLTFFRFKTMSVTSSTTPSIVANSCIAPSTFNEVMAAPSSEESSTRRSELPMVWP